MRKPFANKLCAETPPIPAGILAVGVDRGCIRHNDHKGPHRNRVVEWDQELTKYPCDFSDLRPRKDK